MGKNKWTTTPKHLLRKMCVVDVIKDLKPGRFLEMGAGTGDFTKIFLESGYKGICYDISEITRNTLSQNLSSFRESAEVVSELATIPNKEFDYLIAFEVLEHVVNDEDVLRTWLRYLKPGGTFIMSVPAHMSSFGASDERVGHIRRYEKAGLNELLERLGFNHIDIYCWGFPLANITGKVGNSLQRNITDSKMTQVERSVWSGQERTQFERIVSIFLNKYTLIPFFMLQRLFYGKDLGEGYVVIAKIHSP